MTLELAQYQTRGPEVLFLGFHPPLYFRFREGPSLPGSPRGPAGKDSFSMASANPNLALNPQEDVKFQKILTQAKQLAKKVSGRAFWPSGGGGVGDCGSSRETEAGRESV